MEARGKVFIEGAEGMQLKAAAVTVQKERKSNVKGRRQRSEGWQEEPAR